MSISHAARVARCRVKELSVHGKSALLTAASTEQGAPQASTEESTSLGEDKVTADFLAELARGLTPRAPTHGTPRPPHSPVLEPILPAKGPRRYTLQRAFGYMRISCPKPASPTGTLTCRPESELCGVESGLVLVKGGESARPGWAPRTCHPPMGAPKHLTSLAVEVWSSNDTYRSHPLCKRRSH